MLKIVERKCTACCLNYCDLKLVVQHLRSNSLGLDQRSDGRREAVWPWKSGRLVSDQGKVVRGLDVVDIRKPLTLPQEVSILHRLLIVPIERSVNHSHRKICNLDRREKGVHDSSADAEIFRMDMGRSHEVRVESRILFSDLHQSIFGEALVI